MKRLNGKSALTISVACGIGRCFAQAHIREEANDAIAYINIIDAAEKNAAELGDTAYAT